MMKTRLSTIMAGFGAAAAITCALVTGNAQAQTGEAIQAGDTETLTAVVVAIDKQDRTVTLLGPKGNATTFEAGPELRNFDQVTVGDHVNLAFHRSVALHLGEPGTQPTADAGMVVARAPKGAKPGGLAIGAVDVSAVVQSIDRTDRTVTLKGHDGRSVTVEVGRDLEGFDDLQVGDLVHARYTEAIAISVEPALPEEHTEEVSLLFVQHATGISYESAESRLTLEGINPAVIYFSDRPYRIAGHVLVPGFLQLWDEGSDSFKADPPNATLSILDGGDVQLAVIEIADPQLKNDQLSYRVVQVLDGDIPTSAGTSALFIDGLFDHGAGGSGLRGAAGGALIGAISGNAGRGAAIGATVGVIGGAVREGQEEQAAQQAAATTRVVNVPNSNGSFTPVTLHLVASGWQGPRGEIYPTLPTVDQLQSAYGVK